MAVSDVRAATAGHERDRGEWEDFVHTSPGTLGGRFMRLFWHPVFVAADLPAGRAMPVKIMSEEFTLYRGEGGQVHAVAFRCAHRGTQLSTGWVEGDNLRCFYHGWAYDRNGQCVEQPAEPEPFCNRIKIRSYPVREYLGLLFVFMGEGEPPELPRIRDLEQDEAEGVSEIHQYSWPCNYFNSIENDPFHGLWVHRSGYEASGRAAAGIPEVSCEETEYGFVYSSKRPSGRTTLNYRIMPNGMYGRRTGVGLEPGAWTSAFHWRVPVDDTRFVSFSVHFTHVTGEARERHLEKQRTAHARQRENWVPPEDLGEAVLRGELTIRDVEEQYGDRTSIFNVQDYSSQVAQGRIADREHEHLGREDVTVILERQLFQREMRALAEGRPLKQWRMPEAFPVGNTQGW